MKKIKNFVYRIPSMLDVVIPANIVFLLVAYITSYTHLWIGLFCIVFAGSEYFLYKLYSSFCAKTKETGFTVFITLVLLAIIYLGMITFVDVAENNHFNSKYVVFFLIMVLVCGISGVLVGEKAAQYTLKKQQEEEK